MGDHRLNSMHLDSSRRDHYRRARQALLQSCGNETAFAESRQRDGRSSGNTAVRQQSGAAAPHAEFWLSDQEFIYPLKVGLNTMGRSGDNDVVVEDLYVSRRHAAILVHHDHTYVLHDTASKNGTYLNGNRLAGSAPLKSGDEICICNRHFVFLTHPSHGAPPPTPTLAG